MVRSFSPSPVRAEKKLSRGRSPTKAKTRNTSRGSSSGSSSSGSGSSSGSSSSASSRSGSSSSSSSGSSSSRSRSRSQKKVENKATTKEKTKGKSASRSHSRSPRKKRKSASPAKATKIYIGKLTRNVTKEHVTEIFSAYGSVKSAEVPQERRMNIPAGHAYVEFNDADSASKAEKYMNGGQIDGQEIVVRCVLPVSHRRRSPPRGIRNPLPRGAWRGRSPPRFRGRRSPVRSPPRRRSPGGRRSPMRRRSRSKSGGHRSRSPAGRRSRSPVRKSPINGSKSPARLSRSPVRRGKSSSRSSSR